MPGIVDVTVPATATPGLVEIAREAGAAAAPGAIAAQIAAVEDLAEDVEAARQEVVVAVAAVPAQAEAAATPAGTSAGTAAANAVVANKADITFVKDRAPDSLRDLGAASWTVPYVIVAMGQSTEFGTDPGGSKFVDQSGGGIWVVNQQTSGSTAVVQAAFGQSPYNYEKSTGLRTSDPALSCNNSAVHHANEIRRLGSPRWIHPDRPILIIPSAKGGASISEWVPSGGGDGPMWTNFLAQIAVAQAWWTAQGYPGVVTFDVWRWSQGETDGTTLLPYNTDATYKAGFNALRAKMAALAGWQPQTITLLHEMGRWGKLAVNGLAPTVARNQALRELAQELPLTGLVDSYGLDTTGLDGDQNHFTGAAHVERGIRSARLNSAMRQTYGVRTLPRTKWGSTDIRTPTLNISNETRSLSQDEMAGGAVLVLAGDTLSLPDPNVMVSLDNIVHVWSRGAMPAGQPASILLPYQSNQTIVFDGVAVSQANLDLNCRYRLSLSRGSYQLTSIDPAHGNFLPRSETIPTGGSLGLSGAAAFATTVQCLGGSLGLPAPSVGARVATILRSTSGGTNKLGRSLNSVSLASGGTGYVVGDTFTSDLNGAAGIGFSGTVLTIGTGGAIATFSISNYGCLMQQTLTGPLGVAATSGVGVGATFNPSIGNFGYYTLRGDFVYSLTLSRIDGVVEFVGTPGGGANPGGWRMVSDTTDGRSRVVTPTNGQTTGVLAGDCLVVNPAAALASLPLALPATPYEGDQFEIRFTKAVTSLTWTVATPVNAPTSAAAGDCIRRRYVAAAGGWV